MNGAIRKTRRLLGEVLLDGSFVSPGDLQDAIQRQRKTNAQLGSILVEMGVLNAADIEAVLSVQRVFASPQDTIKAAAGERELLGELLIQAKRLTPESLNGALEEHRHTGEKLGRVLVRNDVLTKSELNAVLAFQRRQGARKSARSPLRLGEILIRTGAIPALKLQEALRHQKLSGKKIGIILVESGYIKPEQLEHGMGLQQKLITAGLIGLLTFASVSQARAIDLPPSRTRAKIQASTTPEVRSHGDIKIIRQVHEIVVSNTDIDRGYIDFPAASLIEVKGSSPTGNFLTCEGMKWPFHEAQVAGLAGELRISGGSGRIPHPTLQGGTIRELSYHFLLMKNAEPGTYAWPLRISAETGNFFQAN